MDGWKNKLYYGDNLDVLREMTDESVDLVYLDPPFNSKANYNVLFENKSGESSEAQIFAFKDTWDWDQAAAEAFHEIMTSHRVPERVRQLVGALKVFLTGDTGKSGNSMMAYVVMITLRINEIHRILHSHGSLYFHCDPTASHYIKPILDAIFGFAQFKSEIIWHRTNAHNFKVKKFSAVHDTIFFYTKSGLHTWNQQYTEYSVEQLSRYEEDSNGDYFTGQDLTIRGTSIERSKPWRGTTPSSGRVWALSEKDREDLWQAGLILTKKDGTPRLDGHKVYLKDKPGKKTDDLWSDISRIGNTSAERLGYPTQKPEALLERIILASTNEGDVVLDPFCGCGTTVAVAERLKRRWIGIDITYLAVDLMERRLLDMFTPAADVKRLADIPVQMRRKALNKYWTTGEDELGIGIKTGLQPYEVIGDPKDLDSAQALADNDKFQFEWWCVSQVGAQSREKKGADRGIDGVITFMDREGEYEKAIVSVKGGKVGVAQIRDLVGTIDRESAAIGVFICIEEPTSAMLKEAASAGRWQSKLNANATFPRIQILTVSDIFNGKRVEIPAWGLQTFKKAKKVSTTKAEQFLIEE